MRNILKKYLILLLMVAMVFSSNNIILASEISEVTQVLLTDTIEESSNDQVDYTATKELANKKALTITSIYGATSIQYALIDNGEIVISDNAGVYSKTFDTPLSNQHMYGIGSISKIFTAAAVMKLVDEGKIDLDTPVINYITDFKMVDERYVYITPRMLLNHSSGLMGTSYDYMMLFGDNDTKAHDNFLNTLSTQRLKADPGAYSVYCNDGFTLAEILIERVSKESFTDYILENFTKPLTMFNTKTPLSNFQQYNLAKIYMPLTKTALPTDNLNTIGAGGIYSTAEDLCKFSETFMKDSNSILSKESIDAMANKEYLNGMWGEDTDSILGYGLGWDSVNLYPFNQYGIKVLSKVGDTAFYHANILVAPEYNMAIAVLSSGSASTYNQIMAQEILLSAMKEKGIIEEIKPNKTFTKPIQAKLPKSLKTFEGLYATNTMILGITMDNDGTLNISNALTQSPLTQYYYTKDKVFVSSNGSAYIKFIQADNGESYLYEGAYSLVPGLGQTAFSNYSAQKLTDNIISKKTLKAWEARENKTFFCISEKYSSQLYYVAMPITTINLLKDLSGHVDIATIIDDNNAKSLINIPGTSSRDLHDYEFYTKNSIEYLNISSMVYISEDGVKKLSKKDEFTVTIGKDNMAKWYKISKKSANKKITVDVPNNASMMVYDNKGDCIYNSYVKSKKTITLPKGGYVVFIGDVDKEFLVKYK